MQQGPFAPRALPRFNATTNPAATVSSSTVFPRPPVMRSTLLRRFLDGTRTASPVAWHVLVTVLSLVIRKKEDRVLTGRQPWELRSCELVFASVEVLHSVAAGPPTQ